MAFEQLNPAACRTYMISDESDAALIDPVIDHVSDYLNLIKERGLTLTHVVDTHTHADHISAGPSLKDATGCEYIMHEKAPAECVSQRLRDGDEIMLAGQKAKVVETFGHTRDSISLLFEDKILTGDFLFLEDGGAGRDDLPGGNAEAHWKSLQKLKDMPGNIVVYPAHEYRDRQPSSLDIQRAKNPHLKKEDKEEFISYINDLKLGPADWMKDVLKANYRCATDPNAAWIPADVPACEIKGTMNPNAGNIQVHYVRYHSLNPDAVLVDVREESELNGPLRHLEGIIHIPVGEVTHRLDELIQFREHELVLVCRSGARATTAAQILITAGFDKVKVLDGGMLAVKSEK